MLHEFAFNSEEEHKEGRGRFHEFAVDTEEMQAAWVDALPPPRQFTVQGYLHKRRVGARKLGGDFDMRYAVYDVISGFFAYYESEQDALCAQGLLSHSFTSISQLPLSREGYGYVRLSRTLHSVAYAAKDALQ